jgi:signal transduction histidine kinase
VVEIAPIDNGPSSLAADLASDNTARQLRALRLSLRGVPQVGLGDVLPLVHSADDEVRAAALGALGATRDHAAVSHFLDALGDGVFEVRSAAGWALVLLGADVAPAVEAFLARSRDPAARQMALLVLERLAPRALAVDAAPLRVGDPRGIDPIAVRALAAAHDMNNKLHVLQATVPWLRSQASPAASSDDVADLDCLEEGVRRMGVAIRHALHLLLDPRAVAAHRRDMEGDGGDGREFGGVMHDLIGCSALASASVELLAGRAPIALTPEGAAELPLIKDLLRALAAQQRDFFDRVCFRMRREGVRPRRVAVRDLARRFAWTLRRLADPTGLRTGADATSSAPAWVVLDELALERVVDNLLTNAVRYTPRGEVSVALGGDGAFLTVRVRDTGRGMEPHQLARAFEHGASDRELRAAQSYGVGLAGVAQQLRDVGGRIEVASEVGVGTTFDVWFPAVSEGSAPET